MILPHPPTGSASSSSSSSRRMSSSFVGIGATFLVLAQAIMAYGYFSFSWCQSANDLSSALRGTTAVVAGPGATGRREGAGFRPLPYAIPEGQPPNLPRLDPPAHPHPASEDEEVDAEKDRGIYGGRGDGKHLGGFTDFDPDGVAPNVWANMMTVFGVKSIMDIGCGRGISTRWFLEHHANVLCVEGSKDAIRQSFLPSDLIVEHDYSRGPWWPKDTYDAAWSVEFLEHVSRQYMRNYMLTLRKAAIVFASSSRWGGWHHMEVHTDDWWIRKFAAYGFVYDDKLTQLVRNWASNEQFGNYTLPDGGTPRPQHVYLSKKVFLNPAVLSLPAQDHLFEEGGCIGNELPNDRARDGQIEFESRRCGTGPDGSTETELPDSYEPLPVVMSMHERWIDAIRAGIKQPEKK